MAAAAHPTAPPQTEIWLTVHDASAMLGVSPATLRRWSVNGEVEAFTTPGGHRRYALSTVQALLPGPATPMGLSALGGSSSHLVRAIRRHARSATHDGPWLSHIDDADRQRLRERSHDLTEALVEHLDATTRPARASSLRLAEASALRLGEDAACAGCCLAETLAVFLRFRSLTLTEISAVSVRRGLSALEATALVTRCGETLDRMLQALVGAFSAAGDPEPGS